MDDEEIIKKWKQGLNKITLSIIYKRRYNQNIKINRMSVGKRHLGKFLSNYEALNYVEKVIYKYLKDMYH